MNREREETRTLEILEAIEARSDVTQRHLADRLGVALGLANSYLRRCVRKGLIKITQAPANRYLYYLTPKGFAEKSRLTGEYLSFSFAFYRRASESLAAALHACEERGLARIVFVGVSELAEIGSVRADECSVTVLGTYDPASKLKRFVSLPVWHTVTAIPACDAAVFTALTPEPRLYEAVVRHFGIERVVVPRIVRPLLARGGAEHTGDRARANPTDETTETT